MTRPKQPDYTADAVQAFIEAARTETDFAGWACVVLARTAAAMGGSEELLAGRPGSWEAVALRQVLASTVGPGDEALLFYQDGP